MNGSLYDTWSEWEARTHGTREEYEEYVQAVKRSFEAWVKRKEASE